VLFWEWHPWPAKLRPKVPKIRISVRASLFGKTLTARPAVPRGYLLASMSDPKPLTLIIQSMRFLNKPQWRLPWGNLKGYFMIQFPGRTAWGFVFEPSSSTSSTTRTSATPNDTLDSPLFGRSTQTLASSLGSGGANGGFNPLYQIGGARSIQLALKLQL